VHDAWHVNKIYFILFLCLTLELVITMLVSHVLITHTHIYLPSSQQVPYLAIYIEGCFYKVHFQRVHGVGYHGSIHCYKQWKIQGHYYNIHSIEHACTNHDLQVLLWKFNDSWLESFHLWKCIDIKIQFVIVVKCQKWYFGSIHLQHTSIVVMCIDFS
jgi:hypothetical protein